MRSYRNAHNSGFEAGTSRTRSENRTPRPMSHVCDLIMSLTRRIKLLSYCSECYSGNISLLLGSVLFNVTIDSGNIERNKSITRPAVKHKKIFNCLLKDDTITFNTTNT